MKTDNLTIPRDDTLTALVKLSHQIQEALVESMGELTPELEQSIAKLHNNLPAKADAYVFFIEDLKSQAQVFSERAAILSRIGKAMISYTDRLKYTLKMACLELGTEELLGTNYKWKLVSNAPSLVVDNEELVPSKFKEIVQTTKIRSDLLKEALKNGENIPGAHIETGSHCRSYPRSKK